MGAFLAFHVLFEFIFLNLGFLQTRPGAHVSSRGRRSTALYYLGLTLAREGSIRLLQLGGFEPLGSLNPSDFP